MERIIIDVTSDSSKLQATIDKLNQMGVVDEKNAQQFKKNNTQFNNQLSITQKAVGGIEEKLMNVGKAVIAAFAIERVYAFTREIINVRAEFQRFEAQLTTALGNKSAAQAAMTRLIQFAKETPFSVKELTESFVRLANRGINATNEQFKKLGDVAAALGKPMEQVIEAILDINNTERWNELGIKVKTNGDKITGTFKGMTVEMNRTEQGAMAMIEKFGELDTVAGGMERQMETLGGVMSNLGDAWDKLLNALGEQTQGVLANTITALSDAIDWWGRYYSAAAKADKMQVQIAGSLSQWLERTIGIGKGATEAETLTRSIETLDQVFGRYTENVLSNAKALQKQYSEQAKAAKSDAERTKLQQQLSDAIDRSTKTELQSYNNIIGGLLKFNKQQKDSGEITNEIASKNEYVIRQYQAKIMQTNVTQKELIASLSKYKDFVTASTVATNKHNKAHQDFMDIVPPLQKKLQELENSYKSLDISRLKGQEQLDAQRNLDRDKAKQQYDEEIARIEKANREKKLKKGDFEKANKLAQSIYDQELLNIQKKYGYDSKDLELKLQKEKIEMRKSFAQIDAELLAMEYGTEEEVYEMRLKANQDYYNDLIKITEDKEEKLKLIKQRDFEDAKIKNAEKNRIAQELEEERNELRRHELAMLEITDAGEKAILKKKIEYSNEDLNRLREDFGEGSDEYKAAYNRHLELQEQYNKKSKEKNKEWVKGWVDGINEILQTMLDAMDKMIQLEIEANDVRIANQQQILQTQRVLAEKGLDNTLAFEQKRNDELYKQQLQAKEKQKRIKELEVFLNALAKYAEDDPNSALGKALGLLAATKIAEAVFAEEGAIIGTHETKFRGQRHRSGRDRIAIVEEGEVILPKSKAAELGLNSSQKFRQFLKTPFTEKSMAISSVQVNNYDKLAVELRELKEIVKNKQELSVNWDNFESRIETRIKNGLKEVTTIKRPRI